MVNLQSVLLFVAAGLCEIGGGYLVWLWLREGRTPVLGALGGLVLVLYGIIPTLQSRQLSALDGSTAPTGACSSFWLCCGDGGLMVRFRIATRCWERSSA